MKAERWQRVEEIYHAARERQGSVRDDFLADACGGDEALRREVESLLEYEEQSEKFIEAPALEVAAKVIARERVGVAVGQNISHYQIISFVGAGGMGEVYRALDNRLSREVAIKLLPTAYSTDPDRLRRFEQEARAAGMLNHPNVLTIYDIGTHEGAPYIVSEFLTGETLRARLNQTAIPLRRVVDYGQQIARGLAAAHEVGIVHRDLKPENLFVTKDGRIKVLDFGLAKLKPSPTDTNVSTQLLGTAPGVVMGTVGYMSPEQVRGDEVDHRSDVFAFGAILYEMLTGRRAFVGDSGVEVMNAILKDEPLEISEPKVSPAISRVVRHCLEKSREERFQSMADVAFDLEPVPSTAEHQISTVERTQPGKRFWMAIAVGVTVLTLVAFLGWRLNRSDYWWSNPLDKAQFTPLTDFPEMEREAIISRDGKFVAFVSDRDGPLDVWAGQIGSGEFHNLTQGRAPGVGNPRVRNLAFSPDGSQLAMEVRVEGRVFSWGVPTMGGPVRPVSDGVEIAWSHDGKRSAYHTDAPGDPIFVSAADEKIGTQIYVAEPGVHCHYLTWSPAGDFIYFVRGFPSDEMDIWRIRPTGGTAEQMTFHNSRVAYPAFLNERTLLYTARADDGTGPWLYGMDVDRRTPHRISLGVERYTSISASADGHRLVATVANPDAGLWRVPISDRPIEETAAKRLNLPTMRGLSPRVGPDYLLYLSSKGGNDGLWKFSEGTAVELWSGSNGRLFEGAALSPDGQRLAFIAQKGGRNRLYLMNSNGTGVTELASSLDVRGAPAWPPAGDSITVAANQGNSAGLFKVPLDGGQPVQLMSGQATNLAWSPDANFLVYSGVDVGTSFPLKAISSNGQPYNIPEVILPRGANRFAFVPGQPILIVLKGDVWHKNFWWVDLTTGQQRQLTNFSREFLINDFDVSLDGKEIIFSRLKENANVILIDLPEFK